MRQIGYIRESTSNQKLGIEAQTKELLAYGVAKDDLVIDSGVSGAINQQSKKLKALLKRIEAETEPVEVVVTKLDRWSRDPDDAIQTIKWLSANNACFTSLAEGVRQVTDRDDTGKLILRIFLAVAEMERARIAERTREALAALTARHIPLGPPPKLSTKDVEWIQAKHNDEGWGAQRITKALPSERNVTASKSTVLRVLGMGKGVKPYVPSDNHKYEKRAAHTLAKRKLEAAA